MAEPQMQWFRMYSDLLNDPQVQRLSDSLFRAYVNLLCLANQGEPRGRLPEKLDDIAFRLRITPRKTQQILDELRENGLLVVDPDDEETARLMPSTWDRFHIKNLGYDAA